MTKPSDIVLSVVVPLYNEAAGLPKFHGSLLAVLDNCAKDSYEIIYCNDGSTDDTDELVRKWSDTNSRIKLISFSRNFGKESALSAGIAEASGDTVLMLDGDGQHPVELIPQFLEAWRAGAQVVVGVSTNRRSETAFKRLGSRIFYTALDGLAGQKLAGMTDFRLLDRQVCEAFLTLSETDRFTRGLIDWLGFRRSYIEYEEKARESGEPGYKLSKLVKLAANSFVSLTPTPLYLFGYLGVFITLSSFLLGTAVLVEQVLMEDPWQWKFTGTAMLGILILFLVGIVLMSQGILSLYISHISSQCKQRPLYVIDYSASAGLKQHRDA